MTLIVEDGSEVAGANTYISDDDYTTYAAARGLVVGIDAPAREVELIKAMDYIESHRRQFKGLKITDTQPLQWPRVAVWVDSFPVDSDEIPQELKNAQAEAAAAISASIDPLRNEDTQNIKREKVEGAVEVEYFEGGSWTSPRLDRADAQLRPLLKNVGMVVRA